jgi:hypothetical protein
VGGQFGKQKKDIFLCVWLLPAPRDPRVSSVLFSTDFSVRTTYTKSEASNTGVVRATIDSS